MESVKLDCGCYLDLEENFAYLTIDDLRCGGSFIAHIPEICIVTGRIVEPLENQGDLFILSDEEKQ